jgi:predicted esterase
MAMRSALIGWLIIAGFPLALVARHSPAQTRWPLNVEQALETAGANRAEIAKALEEATGEQRKGMIFLVANMPAKDLKSLRADYLLENLRLAYKARHEVPWGKSIPEAIFLNDVLPYANVNESRHAWRKEFYEMCMPIIKECKTPAEAAQKLNSTVFAKLNVKYSTERKKADQSPKESIEQGKASCTGLSIVLADACRSVCVPARLAGTPMWTNMRGNHTWVEIWDETWHFTGACEPDPQGLDRGWFVGDAAKAKEDSRQHSIYAASFQKTATTFPLHWAPKLNDVYAENVTARYAKAQPSAATGPRVLLRVRDESSKKRVALPVEVFDKADPKLVYRGESRGETADTNDMLGFELPAGHEYLVRVGKPTLVEASFKTSGEKEQLVEIAIGAPKNGSGNELAAIEAAAGKFFQADAARQSKWTFDGALEKQLREEPEAVRQAVWRAYKSAPIHGDCKADFDKNEVHSQQHRSPYTVKKVGERPKGGWPLFIAMHGGGGVAKQVNDSQWKQMEKYYKDQQGVGGYLYLALRAPNDSWNGFYDEYVPPLIDNLIRQFLVFGDIDPNKVFLMGYSHGGYGAFYIGPKIADHFAAVHASAAAPTDGAISARNLRNTRFSFMVGEKDTMYGRRERCERFDAEIAKLKQKGSDDYPVVFEFKPGFGHGGLPDRDKIKEMAPFTRNPVPKRVTWDMTDGVVKRSFWLSTTHPGKGLTMDGVIAANAVEIKTTNMTFFEVDLDGRLISFDRPVEINWNGEKYSVKAYPKLVTLCRSMLERGDPEMAFSCQVHVDGEGAGCE